MLTLASAKPILFKTMTETLYAAGTDDAQKMGTNDNLGRTQQANYVNEPGL